ncbi:hypothetical protein CR983_00525 [Candidatus Saccharibacteria bacterium]|nr:MAG: hypothetical protein CR983_00525 [Candidatus Saccharibacteria bacterium]
MRRGDTIVEVMVAFAVFTLVAVGSMTVMNRGLTTAERSLEITLVREQIDAQAAILRYARDTNATAWRQIRQIGDSTTSVGDTCPTTPSSSAFVASVAPSGDITVQRFSAAPASYQQPVTYSQFTLSDTPTSHGFWVVPIRISNNAYDMHIRACWYAPGEDSPTALGTIVRLYAA